MENKSLIEFLVKVKTVDFVYSFLTKKESSADVVDYVNDIFSGRLIDYVVSVSPVK